MRIRAKRFASRFACAAPLRTCFAGTTAALSQRIRPLPFALFLACAMLCAPISLAGCTQDPSSSSTSSTSTGGTATFTPTFFDASFDKNAAETDGSNYIDLSHTQEGYIAASGTSASRLKLQVSSGDMSYNYDMPSNGDYIVVPVNMGSGSYQVRIMENTSGNRYIELFSADANIALESELAPYLRPNLYCNFTRDGDTTRLADELCASADSDSAAFDAIYDYVCNNIGYDHQKADTLSQTTGYIPNPDETLAQGKGICFDYASLFAAMLRSQGIPTKILTGYVSPEDVYHAWDMIYIDGSWTTLHISAKPGSWARADITFAANGAAEAVGDGSTYADRYTY